MLKIQTATPGNDTTFASTVSTAFTKGNTRGNTILVAWQGDTGALNSANTPTDTAGNTYVRLDALSVAATFDLEVWAAFNCKQSNSNTITITDTIGGADGNIIAEEWENIDLIATSDGGAHASGTSNAPASGSFTPNNSDVLIWVAACLASGASNLSAGAGYSNFTGTNTAFTNLGICSQIITTRDAQNGLFASAASASWACIALAFRPAKSEPGNLSRNVSVGGGMSRSDSAT